MEKDSLVWWENWNSVCKTSQIDFFNAFSLPVSLHSLHNQNIVIVKSIKVNTEFQVYVSVVSPKQKKEGLQDLEGHKTFKVWLTHSEQVLHIAAAESLKYKKAQETGNKVHGQKLTKDNCVAPLMQGVGGQQGNLYLPL